MEDAGVLNPIHDLDLFALHYVFIPRINNCIAQFMHAWNHHPLRTERGMSPLQLWQRGMLSASPQWQQEILRGLSVSQDYGVDTSTASFISSFDQQSVFVPRIDLPLTPQQRSFLQVTYLPHSNSDVNGLDIYGSVRNYLLSL